MDKRRRLRIGIVFNFRKGWMGGIIYIINLINSLNSLNDEEKPEIVVFYHRDLAPFMKDFQYPYLQSHEWNFYGFMKGYLLSWLKGKNVFVERMLADHDLQGLYPVNDCPVSSKKALLAGTRIASWIPDLQHKFYPSFFSKTRIFFRERRIKLLVRNTTDLVVSSYDVKSHFQKFYPLPKSLNLHVVHFVSMIGTPPLLMNGLLKKYDLPNEYFMVSNQFTNHKNHILVLRSLALLKETMPRVHVVFTGKMEFKGNEQYIHEFRSTIARNSLERSVSLLGIIPRNDQLSLMKHAKAVIQPSLFEGWSTVIEDAKTLNVPVIASDLPVNKEQLGENGLFFNRNDETELAGILRSFNGGKSISYEKYDDRVKAFAQDFIRIFK
jgi:glycosyltransferase involved in cell wall biosynthesis